MDTENSSKAMFIKYRRVRDHCRFIGKYSGAAHSISNLKCVRHQKKIPVVFHNGSAFDYHFLIRRNRRI